MQCLKRARLGIVLTAAVVVAALATGPAVSHTTSAALQPVANGSYTGWFGDVQDVDETGSFNCGGADSIGKGGVTPDRESFSVDISSVPTGSTITSVDVTVRDGASQADAGGTYQAFVRIDATDTDSGLNLAATVRLFDDCSEPKTQTIDVPDVVKSAATTLEIGVVKTPPDGGAIRVGTIAAAVTYNRAPGAPTLFSPADEATTADTTPDLDWSDATDPDTGDPITYDLQADDSGCEFPSPELDATGVAASAFTPGSPLTPGTYCWHARAVDDHDQAGAWSETQTLTLTVDEPPSATADTATVVEDDPATPIEVLANDLNPDGGPMTIESATQPANGAVAVAGDGLSLSYEPEPGYCNDGSPTDDFTYTLGPGGSTATVAVTVTCADDEPAGPCILLSETAVSVNGIAATPTQSRVTRFEGLTVTNCGSSDVNLEARGTDATEPGGGTWQLTDYPRGDPIDNLCDAGPNLFAVAMELAARQTGAEGGVYLTTQDRELVDPADELTPFVFAAGDVADAYLQVAMPCLGSAGLGTPMATEITLTAIAP